MKKILLAFDGSHFSEGVLDFSLRLHQLSPVFVAGVFLPQIDYSALWSRSGGGRSGSLYIPLVEDEDTNEVRTNMVRFENFCKNNKMDYRIHKDFFDFAVPELKKESRFADLLVISSQRFYEQAGTTEPNDYLKEVLHDVECPVVVVPEKFNFPNKNILAYDGKEESVFAIKQFAYLFPELMNNETMLVYATNKDEQIPNEENMEELCRRHFRQLSIFRLGAEPKKAFPEWLKDKDDAIVICGSFGRSSFSQLFHKSFISDVIKDHQLPVFVAHK